MTDENPTDPMAEMFLSEWKKIRQLTYDYLDVLETDQLSLRLPFEESQSILYQFWCMTGAHESYIKHLKHGSWQGFASSLSGIENRTPALIKQHMMDADTTMEAVMRAVDLSAVMDDGKHGYEVVMQMIKHEMHHHGQLINLMFCHRLPIPESWNREWALAYGD